MDQGYQCVTDYYEIADMLYQVLPDKEELLHTDEYALH